MPRMSVVMLVTSRFTTTRSRFLCHFQILAARHRTAVPAGALLPMVTRMVWVVAQTEISFFSPCVFCRQQVE